jgi:hypothetical protein
MQPQSCAERHPILASLGVAVLAVIVAYWWSAAAVVVVAATGCACVTLQRWWRFEVAAHRNETALLNAAEHELDAAEHKLVKRDEPRTQRLSRR